MMGSVYKTQEKLEGTTKSIQNGQMVRANTKVFFRLTELRDFWQAHRDEKFSYSDAIKLLLDFYEQFYPRHREEFKK